MPHGRLRQLDTLRGLAALLVGFTHAFYVSGRPGIGRLGIADILDSGYLAVDFFFVLSGFVLFTPAVRRQGELGGYRRFLFKRYTRLWPVYALVLGAAVAAHPLTGVKPAALPPSAQGTWEVLTHAVMLPTVLLGYGPHRLGLGVDAVVWTLSIEMSFSLVLPLIARWWFRHPVLGLGAALILSRTWILVTTTWGPGGPTGADGRGTTYAGARLILSLPTYALHFAVGMSLAHLMVSRGEAVHRRLAGPRASIAFALGVATTGWLAYLLGHADVVPEGYRHWTVGALMLPSFGLIIVSATMLSGRLARAMASTPGTWLGEASYPFYLVHTVIMSAVYRHDALIGWGGFTVCAATLPISFIVAMVLHRVIEKPIAEWGRRRSQLGPPAPPAPIGERRKLLEPDRRWQPPALPLG